MVETVYEQGYLHGQIELSPFVDDSAGEFLDPSGDLDRLNSAGMAVIDTETTGLAGGTGTYPFIIGVGFWSHQTFIVRQYLLRDFCEEPAQLAAVSDDLACASSLLTYNGKSFDIPLLKTRYRINRMTLPFGDIPHLDLLHPCRRIYKDHFESFNLSTLEALVVGFERTDDVPSYLIPSIYFDFLQNRNAELLIPILNHNRDDIVSLYLLLQETSRRISLALNNAVNDDLLYLSLGRELYKSRKFDQAEIMLSRMKTEFMPDNHLEETMMLKALTARKSKNWDSARQIWNDMINSPAFGFYPHIELAKYYEHRINDPRSALELTNTAINILELERELSSGDKYREKLSLLKKRQLRLLKKIDSKNKGAGEN